MTRYVVAQEGTYVNEAKDIFLERRCLTVMRAPIPVTYGFDSFRQNYPVGLAHAMERDESTNEVSFDITWHPSEAQYYEKVNMFALSLLMDFVSRVGSVQHVHTGVIVGISVLGFSQD